MSMLLRNATRASAARFTRRDAAVSASSARAPTRAETNAVDPLKPMNPRKVLP